MTCPRISIISSIEIWEIRDIEKCSYAGYGTLEESGRKHEVEIAVLIGGGNLLYLASLATFRWLRLDPLCFT